MTAPTANALTYNGTAQNLINAGEASGGEMLYAFFEDGEYTIDVPATISAGTYTVWYYVQGDENHNDSDKESVEVTIAKATPDYEIPTNLTAIYGETLSDVTLPEGFTWEDEKQSVGNAGTNAFTATFTPNDTDNYEVIEGIEVEVTVAKATPEVTPVIPEGEYFVGDALPEIGFNSAVSGLIQWITQLVDGLIEGENELEWQFTPTDNDNYEVVTGTAVVEAQTTTTTTSTTTTTTSTSTETTTTTATHIASDKKLCDWAVKDYAKKTGVTPDNAEIEYTADGKAVITLTDANGNILDVYNIDPFTGAGTESDGGEVNLPQTGYSVVYNYIMLAAAAMVLFGIYAMAKGRKRDKE